MRHRTPRHRRLSLFCVNTAGARVLLTLALAASTGVHAQSVAPVLETLADLGEVAATAARTPLTIARALAMRTPGGATIACASSTPAAQPRTIVSS